MRDNDSEDDLVDLFLTEKQTSAADLRQALERFPQWDNGDRTASS